jgi:hypothetical protein
MTRRVVWAAVAWVAAACTTITPEGSKVKVYEANLAQPPEARRLPQGCRLLDTTPPVDQMEAERHTQDPYRVERNATAAKGGNVLLVLSQRTLSRPMTDCSPSDNSPDCQARSQNWYKVGFESYACDGASLEALARIPPPDRGGIASWWPFDKKTPTPASAAPASAPAPAPAPAASAGLAASELKSKILVLMREGVGADVIVAYVRSNRLRAPLTAEEILDWRKSGISDAVIEAALAPFASAR